MSGKVKDAHLGFGARFLRGFAWCLVHTVQRPVVSGRKPELDEPTIFVCSHVGLMDPVVLMVTYFPWMLRPLVAKDYYDKNGFTRWFYPLAQCIPIDRKNVSVKWLEDSMAALSRGEHIIIFPEGKRNKTGKGLLPFHSGAALLASMSGARLVPVYNEFWNFPHRYRLTIGEPFRLPPAPKENYSAWIKQQTEVIQNKVAELLPEK